MAKTGRAVGIGLRQPRECALQRGGIEEPSLWADHAHRGVVETLSQSSDRSARLHPAVPVDEHGPESAVEQVEAGIRQHLGHDHPSHRVLGQTRVEKCGKRRVEQARVSAQHDHGCGIQHSVSDDLDAQAEQLFGPAGEDLDRPALQAGMSPHGRGGVQAGSEPRGEPEQRRQQDLHRVVEQVLERNPEQSQPGETEPAREGVPYDQTTCDQRGEKERRSRCTQHRRNAHPTPLPPLPARFPDASFGRLRAGLLRVRHCRGCCAHPYPNPLTVPALPGIAPSTAFWVDHMMFQVVSLSVGHGKPESTSKSGTDC